MAKITTTAVSREMYPKRFKRKDARTAIYSRVYGDIGRGTDWKTQTNNPRADHRRKVDTDQDWSVAADIISGLWRDAAFKQADAAILIEDFNRSAKGAANISFLLGQPNA